MKTLRNLLVTKPADWAGLAQAYFFLSLAGWKLFVRNESIAPWVMSEGGDSALGDPLTDREELVVLRAARWVNAAARRPVPWARCLQRSLAVCLLLQHQGICPGIRIGVRREGEGIEAHAWAEYRGRVLNDKEVITKMFPELSGAMDATVRTR